MKAPSFNTVVAGMVVLAGGAMAQLATITLPYVVSIFGVESDM